MKQTSLKPKKFNGNLLAFSLFAVLIAAFYGNTLLNGFVHDDIGQIVQNEYIHSWRYLPKVVTGCIWESALGSCQDSNFYRPAQSLTYLLAWQISSKPWFFHLINLLYFFATASLVFILIKKLSKNFVLSFLTALFFIIHPLNNEVVNWPSAVPELLFLIFILLSTLFFVQYRLARRGQVRHGLPLNPAVSALFYFLAILSKEPAILLPLVFILLDLKIFKVKYFIIPRGRKKATLHTLKASFAKLLPYALFFGAAVMFFIARLLVVKSVIGTSPPYFGTPFSWQERAYAGFTLFAQYLGKLIFPYPLNFFYYFSKQASFTSLGFAVSVLATAAFFAAIIYLFWRKQRLPAIFLVWIFIFISPAIIFLDAAGENVFSERYLFASNVGFAYILAYVFAHAGQKKKQWRIFAAAAAVFIVGLSWYVVFPRNQIFKNDFTLYEATLKINPRAHSLRRNLAVELTDAGKYDEAKAELDKIVELAPPDWWEMDKVYNQTGNYYSRKGDLDRALEYYKKAIDVSRGLSSGAINNAGAVYMEKAEYLRALPYLCRAIRLDPQAKETNSNFNRLVVLLDSVESPEALRALYVDITQGGVFHEEENTGILYTGGKRCDKERCQIDFVFGLGGGEVMLPFLILAATPENEIVKVKDKNFDPRNQTISVSMEVKYQELDFIFPTCAGQYFKVHVGENEKPTEKQ